MSDETHFKRSVDRKKININEAYDFQYWCVRFDCATDELWGAVPTVGTQVDAVSEYLDKRKLASSTLH